MNQKSKLTKRIEEKKDFIIPMIDTLFSILISSNTLLSSDAI